MDICSKIYDFSCSVINYITSSESEEANLIETPSFGAAEWGRYFGREVTSVDVPESLSARLDRPCPFWAGKLIKETHFLCLIPEGLTLRTLWKDIAAKEWMPPEIRRNPSADAVIDRSYWILITKEVVPGSRSCGYDREEDKEVLHNYQLPTLIEAIAAVMALKASANLEVYPHVCRFTRCQRIGDEYPLFSIGSQTGCSFAMLMNDTNFRSGVAAVLKE